MAWSRRRRLVVGAVIAVASPLAVGAVRALTLSSRQPVVAPLGDAPVEAAPVASILGEAVRCRTVSTEDTAAATAELHAVLARAFPRVHASLTRDVVDGRSLLYTWKGAAPAEKSIVLLSHLDVVPVEAGTEKEWTRPPFSGDVTDGFVWGRGTLDDKVGVVSVLSAVERLLESGFTPRRTVLLAFGHDEEVGGAGARAVANRLREAGTRAEVVLDEGGPITVGIVPGVHAPVAVVGIAEKGYASVDLSVSLPGGHSSMPGRESAITVLTRALARLQENPMPAHLDGPMGEFAAHIAPEMSFGPRFAFANPWLTRPLLERALSSAPSTNASLRTTTAITIVNAGVKDNVLPATATATVNFRILPGDSRASVLAHVRSVVDDPRVEVSPRELGASEPSPTSSSRSASYVALARTVREVFPGVVVAPALFLGATDARHYVELADDVYRFLPVPLTAADLTRIHGKDERVRVSDLAGAVRFYRRFIEVTAGR